MAENMLINMLLTEACFPHSVKYRKLIETHISWVILTGDYAYKIKKPLDFGFLDFSTLEKREYYCREEMRLNKLLAPELYLDVIKFTGSPESPQFNGNGAAFEYAIKMREFSQEKLFSELLEHKAITPELIDSLAQLVTDFHKETPVAACDSAYGTPEHVHAPVLQNFDQILPLLNTDAEREELAELRNWAEVQYKTHYALLEQRKSQGFIRDCHGDLHLGNIILYNQKPLLFDRIEFNEDFRWTDVMADLAFLAMDLIDHQQKSFAYRLINGYLAASGDYAGLVLLPYYIAYRAMVRAKVSLFRLQQTGLSSEQQQAIKQKYADFIYIAKSFLKQSQPKLFITHGLSASGKSTVSRILVEQLGAVQISSDRERKRLFALSPDAKTNARTAADVNQGIYADEATEKTYLHLAKLAQLILQAGNSVVVDATFLKKVQRDIFAELACKLKIPFVILNCQAASEQLEERLITRQEKMQEREPSEAFYEVLQMQKQAVENLSQDEKIFTVHINTNILDINTLLKFMDEAVERTGKYA